MFALHAAAREAAQGEGDDANASPVAADDAATAEAPVRTLLQIQ